MKTIVAFRVHDPRLWTQKDEAGMGIVLHWVRRQ